MLSAEFDYTSIAEKQAWADRLGARMVVIRGSRHGTPFDAIEATNACLLAFLAGAPLPPPDRWVADPPDRTPSEAPVITSYSIHYTKLYDWLKLAPRDTLAITAATPIV